MIDPLIRKNIRQLTPYSSARDEFKGEAFTFLDANENPFPSAYNRYPDSKQKKFRSKIASLKSVTISQVFVGNGSDEAIDLLIRAFCEPNQDSILITDPTYGMYEVCAAINGVHVQRIPLNNDFSLDSERLLQSIQPATKLIFLCSPNNPSGNLLNQKEVERIIQSFTGLVVIDEAYIDFANDPGFIPALVKYQNLVVLQTLSKAWGMAGLRLGICLASEEIIRVLNKIKYPYNVNMLTQHLACEALEATHKKDDLVKIILQEREKLIHELSNVSCIKKIYPSNANFILIKVLNANQVYQLLLQKGIVVRNRSTQRGCENCLRITIGTPAENQLLINAFKNI